MPSEAAFANEGTVEIRLHGRGGQGTVTMAALLVDAAFRSGWHAMGFPSFGSERTGAPVAAFVRLDRAPILDRSEVRHPSVVVVQDATLAGPVPLLEGLAADGLVVVNAVSVPVELAATPHVVATPITDLAIEHLGSPITSTAMLGVFAAVSGIIDVDAVCAAVHERFGPAIAARNEALARAAYAMAHRLAGVAA